MIYSVKECFLTLQGEGAQSGSRAVFLRFAGCNLWSGREADRKTAQCRFCDTDFVGTDGTEGGRYAEAATLADKINALWPPKQRSKFVVCTGGEPLLQLDTPLIEALHLRGFAIAVETNGTIPLPADLDWVCVSPKGGNGLVVQGGDELKVVVPQDGLDPLAFGDLSFRRFSVQPMDGPEVAQNTEAAIAYCLRHPQWRLSLQTHKTLGIR